MLKGSKLQQVYSTSEQMFGEFMFILHGHTLTLGKVTGHLLVRASRAGRCNTVSVTGFRGRAESTSAGFGAGTP